MHVNQLGSWWEDLLRSGEQIAENITAPEYSLPPVGYDAPPYYMPPYLPPGYSLPPETTRDFVAEPEFSWLPWLLIGGVGLLLLMKGR